jgi:cytochrome P450
MPRVRQLAVEIDVRELARMIVGVLNEHDAPGELRDAMMDVSTFSSQPALGKALPSAANIAYHQALVERGWPRQATLQRTDPPVHTRYRKLLNRIFTPATVREFTPHIDEIATSLIDEFAHTNAPGSRPFTVRPRGHPPAAIRVTSHVATSSVRTRRTCAAAMRPGRHARPSGPRGRRTS